VVRRHRSASLVAVALGAVVASAPTAARANEPRLWDPSDAVLFLLAPPAPEAPPAPAPAWDGALTSGLVRVLYGGYREILSSQDLPVCGFSPSCSKFSERAIARCGFVEGALLSLDRLIRDSPLAVGFYPLAGDGRLLKDDPERYCWAAPR
jgi:putative component of membrane protein insertase Oxa1/YidC/SpoIIIJ protein YidD